VSAVTSCASFITCRDNISLACQQHCVRDWVSDVPLCGMIAHVGR
jgi:hypothetical protein